jgi:hypothetical protein
VQGLGVQKYIFSALKKEFIAFFWDLYPRAVVWDEAENRLHAQKALMEFLLTDKIKLA